ncbi:MAG: ATPase [Actinobacteria bacterium]|uniref:histidine kinase n=1 Tax=freshwater metagenome TaxID=449393 RepID=A0A6J6SD59_9ZZZZ|nr:ATPase [Actinomycetota bacterium]
MSTEAFDNSATRYPEPTYGHPDYDAPDVVDDLDDGDFTAEHVGLIVPPVEIEASRHLRRLVAGWGMLSDLSFSDLLLYVPLPVQSESEEKRFLVVNQMRPNTGQTLFLDDVVGRTMSATQRPAVAEAASSAEIVDTVIDSAWLGERIRVTAIPVRFRDQVVAVIASESALSTNRQRGVLEGVYLEVFGRLAAMVSAGIFPFEDEEVLAAGGPRVGDGVILLDKLGKVTFTSPNAISALRRLRISGRIQGSSLTELGVESDTTYRAFFTGRPAAEEVERNEICVVIWCIPLLDGERVDGGLVLLRDISELKSRDRLLISKDATIKEIHHRVKNNLQTISSLLRLQGRRLTEPSAKAAIEESVRRIRSIALVHETLSREDGDEVNFSEILRPLVRMVEEGLTSPDRPLSFKMVGESGNLPSPTATSLAVVLTELLQNVVDHAYPPGSLMPDESAQVRIEMLQGGGVLRVDVIDDGVGMGNDSHPASTPSLGLSIVRGLVSELDGRISFDPADSVAAAGETRTATGHLRREGTRVSLTIPVVRDPVATRPPHGEAE